jgi:hypothetical protein
MTKGKRVTRTDLTKRKIQKHMRQALPCVVIVALCIVFFWRVIFLKCTLLPMDILYGFELPFHKDFTVGEVYNHFLADTVHQVYPWRWFLKQSLEAGNLPLWNPYSAGGYPQLENSTTAALDPFGVLYALLSLERAFSWVPIIHVAAAGVFMYLFLLQIRLGKLAALLGSVAYMFN